MVMGHKSAVTSSDWNEWCFLGTENDEQRFRREQDFGYTTLLIREILSPDKRFSWVKKMYAPNL